MTRSPPGYYRFSELFDKVHFNLLKRENKAFPGLISIRAYDSDIPYEYGHFFNDLDEKNTSKFKDLLKDSSKNKGKSFLLKEILIDSSLSVNYIKNITLMFKFYKENEFIPDYVFLDDYYQEVVYSELDLKKIIDASETRHTIWNALFCSSDETSFFSHKNVRHPISQDIWLNDTNWYGLLIDDSIDINPIIPSSTSREIVYFSKEVSKPCTSTQEPLTENMFHIITPWLEVMSAISLKFGEDIKKISKKTVEIEIE